MDNDFLHNFIQTPTRYQMPRLEDGSTYRPGNPIYDMVAERFTPEEWNAHSDDFKQSVIRSMWQTIRTHDRATWRATHIPLAERSPEVGALLGQLQQGVDNNGLMPADIQGLFGESPTPTDSNLARLEQRARRSVAYRRTPGTGNLPGVDDPLGQGRRHTEPPPGSEPPIPIRLPFKAPERRRG